MNMHNVSFTKHACMNTVILKCCLVGMHHANCCLLLLNFETFYQLAVYLFGNLGFCSACYSGRYKSPEICPVNKSHTLEKYPY